ncbi:MAG: Dual-action metallo-peptidase [Pseudomonadota bacterium]|jgi:hypothetical protein
MLQFIRPTFVSLAAVALGLLGACRQSSSSGESDVESVFYADGRLRSKSINVCWEFTSNPTSEFRSEFQATVVKAFAKTNLKFNGWGKCPAAGKDFRMFIYDDLGSKADPSYLALKAAVVKRNSAHLQHPGHPRVDTGSDQRSWIFGKPAGIILSMYATDAHPDFTNIYNKLSEAGRKNLMISSSLHEMGHAIGMRHEDAHSDNKCTAFDENPLPGDVQIGPWNPASFMERCFYRNFNNEKGIVWPNELDIAGINERYP